MKISFGAAVFGLCLAIGSASAAPLKPAIFAGTLTCYPIQLNATDGSYVYYSDVVEKIDKKGRVTGSATRFDSAMGMSVPVTISGGVKGKIKIAGKGKKAFAYAKGTVTFSDGATGPATFASRKIPRGAIPKSKPAIADVDGLEFLSQLVLLLQGIAYSGSTFSYQGK